MTRPVSLAEVAERRAGAPAVPLWLALSEFLDAFYEAGAARAKMLSPRPSSPLPRGEAAYLAAAAEHLCRVYGLEPPPWTEEAGFFLTQAYWPDNRGPAFEAVCLVESPAAFRRRFIFTEAQPLRRKEGPGRSSRGLNARTA